MTMTEYITLDDVTITSEADYAHVMSRVKRLVETDLMRRRQSRFNVVCDYTNNSEDNLSKGEIFVEVWTPEIKRVRRIVVRTSSW